MPTSIKKTLSRIFQIIVIRSFLNLIFILKPSKIILLFIFFPITYLIDHGRDVTKSFSSSTKKVIIYIKLNERLQYENLLQLIDK